MTDMTSLEIAQMIRSITGYRIFPASQQKRPLFKDPFGRSTNGQEAIERLFGPYPNAMTAIPTGPLNGITVIDLDLRDGVNGFSSLRNLVSDLPRTMIVRTPSGGAHLYYKTGSEAFPNSAGKIGPGIDVRGSGGYVIGFGSVSEHGEYRWDRSVCGFTWRPTPMPDSLKRLLRSGPSLSQGGTSSGTKRSSVQSRIASTIAVGQRNCELASRIGYLLKQYPASQVHKLAHHINQTLTTEPLDDREVDRIFGSILKRELQK